MLWEKDRHKQRKFSPIIIFVVKHAKKQIFKKKKKSPTRTVLNHMFLAMVNWVVGSTLLKPVFL